ncbi:hypothetical protein V8E55_007120 [Tylopilus felleus]
MHFAYANLYLADSAVMDNTSVVEVTGSYVASELDGVAAPRGQPRRAERLIWPITASLDPWQCPVGVCTGLTEGLDLFPRTLVSSSKGKGWVRRWLSRLVRARGHAVEINESSEHGSAPQELNLPTMSFPSGSDSVSAQVANGLPFDHPESVDHVGWASKPTTEREHCKLRPDVRRCGEQRLSAADCQSSSSHRIKYGKMKERKNPHRARYFDEDKVLWP